jgi:DNA-binding NtrC family response regulator
LKPDLPVITISGLMGSEKIQEQLGNIGVVFVPKPFATEKLLLTLREAIGESVKLEEAPQMTSAALKQPVLGK